MISLSVSSAPQILTPGDSTAHNGAMSLFGPKSRRVVHVDFLSRDPNLLYQYPFRYALVYAENDYGGAEAEAATSRGIDKLFWAVELLEAQGWDAMAWDLQGRFSSVVVRRRELPTHAPYTDQPPAQTWAEPPSGA